MLTFGGRATGSRIALKEKQREERRAKRAEREAEAAAAQAAAKAKADRNRGKWGSGLAEQQLADLENASDGGLDSLASTPREEEKKHVLDLDDDELLTPEERARIEREARSKFDNKLFFSRDMFAHWFVLCTRRRQVKKRLGQPYNQQNTYLDRRVHFNAYHHLGSTFYHGKWGALCKPHPNIGGIATVRAVARPDRTRRGSDCMYGDAVLLPPIGSDWDLDAAIAREEAPPPEQDFNEEVDAVVIPPALRVDIHDVESVKTELRKRNLSVSTYPLIGQ